MQALYAKEISKNGLVVTVILCVCVCGTGAWTQGLHFEPLH
jgi:hypothetical protein